MRECLNVKKKNNILIIGFELKKRGGLETQTCQPTTTIILKKYRLI
jgi:hypothetical protein